jgi:hypothetical protein
MIHKKNSIKTDHDMSNPILAKYGRPYAFRGDARTPAGGIHTSKPVQEYIFETYPVLRKHKLVNMPVESDNFAVIIDPAVSDSLEYVIRNVMHFLGEGWGLQIFVGEKSEGYIRQVTSDLGYVHIEKLDADFLDYEAYNKLLKSTGFWQRVRGDNVLIFQEDSLLCRPGISQFIEYDYIGAPWPKDIQISPSVPVGSGGLSLRKKRTMIEICRTCKSNVIPDEDVFFSINLHLRKDIYLLPGEDAAKSFSVETMFSPEPFGIHNAWLYLDDKEILSILKTIDYGIN